MSDTAKLDWATLKRARTSFHALQLLVQSHNEPYEIPTLELASDIHEMATELLNAVSALHSQDAADGIEASIVSSRCGTCGWFQSFPSHKESPESCPTCSSNLVIRSQTGQDEIIYPTVTVN